MKNKNFTLNQELNRIKTLMFEADNLILNKKVLINEQETPETEKAPKTFRTGFKVAQVKNFVNKVYRGGASNLPTFKIKGIGVNTFFDEEGKIKKEKRQEIVSALETIGVKLNPGDLLIKISGDDDKVFFQTVPTKELEIFTKNKSFEPVKQSDLESLPTVKGQEEKPKEQSKPSTEQPSKGGETSGTGTPSASTSGTGTPSASTSGAGTSGGGSSTVEYGKTKFTDLGFDNSKIQDITPEFKSAGYTAGFYYKLNKDTKDVYRLDKNGVVTAVFKRKTGETKLPESFNISAFYTNPLLFESVLKEEVGASADAYECEGDCKGQKTMNQKFTNTVDSIISGKPSDSKPSDNKPSDSKVTPGASSPKKEEIPVATPSDWDYYPCITKNPKIKKYTSKDLGVYYGTKDFNYFSNGRYGWRSSEGKKMGNYYCMGKKIKWEAPDKKTETSKWDRKNPDSIPTSNDSGSSFFDTYSPL